MDKQCWVQKLSQLSLERACTAAESDDSCWLCDNLETWNDVLYPLHLSLIEFQTGKLCLCTLECDSPVDLGEQDTPHDAAFFTVWLPKAHRCVQGINLSRGHPRQPVATTSGCAVGLSSHLRHVSIIGNASFDWDQLLDALEPMQQLESLKLRDVIVTKTLAVKLSQLLSANASSITSVSVLESKVRRNASDVLMSGISKCTNLKELMFNFTLNASGLKDFTELLQSAKSLETLCMREDENDESFLLDDYDSSLRMLLAVCDHLKANGSLTKLDYESFEHDFTCILEALENNDVLRHLVITSYGFESPCCCPTKGSLLKSVLVKNKTLCSLTLGGYNIIYDGAVLISEGLQENTTLECLDLFGSSVLEFTAAKVLCYALVKNKTLRALRLGSLDALADRKALAAELLANEWYARVQTLWSDGDVHGSPVGSVLTSSMCPTEMHLHASFFPHSDLALLCQALSKSPDVQSLNIVNQYLPCQSLVFSAKGVNSLRMMFMENKSLRRVALGDTTKGNASRIMSAVLGLCNNKALAELKIVCGELDRKSAAMFAALLECCEALCSVMLLCASKLKPECLYILNQGLLRNHSITKFIVRDNLSVFCNIPFYLQSSVDSCPHRQLSMGTAVGRNLTQLHRAVRFVLKRNVEKTCAEAFELLESKASLIPCVMLTSGVTEAEAQVAVHNARAYIRRNYFFINQVVCHGIKCFPGEGTQFDQLNLECLLAITKHLKVSDVVAK